MPPGAPQDQEFWLDYSMIGKSTPGAESIKDRKGIVTHT